MILQNAIKIEDTIYISTSRHDYISVDFKGQAVVIDGGIDYFRGFVPKESEIEDLRVTTEESLDIIAEKLVWGTRGKSGQEPLKYIKIKDMDLDHLSALLFTTDPTKISPVHRAVMYLNYLKKHEEKRRSSQLSRTSGTAIRY
jgi:hypothetical protein